MRVLLLALGRAALTPPTWCSIATGTSLGNGGLCESVVLQFSSVQQSMTTVHAGEKKKVCLLFSPFFPAQNPTHIIAKVSLCSSHSVFIYARSSLTTLFICIKSPFQESLQKKLVYKFINVGLHFFVCFFFVSC